MLSEYIHLLGQRPTVRANMCPNTVHVNLFLTDNAHLIAGSRVVSRYVHVSSTPLVHSTPPPSHVNVWRCSACAAMGQDSRQHQTKPGGRNVQRCSICAAAVSDAAINGRILEVLRRKLCNEVVASCGVRFTWLSLFFLVRAGLTVGEDTELEACVSPGCASTVFLSELDVTRRARF